MTVTLVTNSAKQAYADGITSLSDSGQTFDVAAGDLIVAVSWFDSNVVVVSDSASQVYTTVSVANNDSRYLRVHYLLSSTAQTGLYMTASWGGTAKTGGIAFAAYHTDTGTWALDSTAGTQGVAGGYTDGPMVISSFNTAGAGVVFLGGVEFYSIDNAVQSITAPFTRQSYTTGETTTPTAGPMCSCDYITTSAQTGLNPTLSQTVEYGRLGFGGAAFVVSGGGGGGSNIGAISQHYRQMMGG